MTKSNITTLDLINAKVYKDEKVYELAKQLVAISSEVRVISSAAQKLSFRVSTETLCGWMKEIDDQIQATLKAKVL